MRSVARNIAEEFAAEFAGTKVGFSALEITEYFLKYSHMVKPLDHYAINPTRKQLFVESLYFLRPKEQYQALHDLASNPPEMKNLGPDEARSQELLTALHSFLNPTPLGLSFSQLREHTFRADWFTAYGRIIESPSSAITAARTMLETIFKTIITERDNTPDESGDLSRLYRQAQDSLGFVRADHQLEHQVLTGMTSVISGITGLSNEAGDRHGLVDGQELDDPNVAMMLVNGAGTVGLFFIQTHLFTPTVDTSEE